MKENKKIIIAIIAVVLIALVVVGGTYAYWTWTTNTAQRTSVGFTVTDEEMYANLSITGTDTKLAPVQCGNGYTSYGVKKTLTLTYKNATSQPAKITGTLTITAWTANHGTIPTEAFSHLHFAVTTSGDSCAATAVTNMSGTFPTTSTTGTKLIDDKLFLTAPASMTSEGSQTYYMWIWLDKDYTHENVGSVVDDPLQDLVIKTAWTGNMNNTPA